MCGFCGVIARDREFAVPSGWVERMMALVWSGPPAARVDEVLIEDRVLTELVKFDQYPTL